MSKSTIYIYNDAGADSIMLMHTAHIMNEKFASCYDVKFIDAKQLKEQNWQIDASLLVMPGGADLPYVEKLNGEANNLIKNYVANGGKYLGICAGAYYGSAYVEFDKQGEYEVLGARELAFFAGKSIGPILAKYDYNSFSGARAAKVNINSNEFDNMHLYYHGGGYFENPEAYDNVSVVGKYHENNLAAIIAINYQNGRVILSGVHFEVSPLLLDIENPYLSAIEPILTTDNIKREHLFYDLMSYLGVENNCMDGSLEYFSC